MKLVNTIANSMEHQTSRRWLLSVLLLCAGLATAAGKGASPSVRTATFVVAASDSPEHVRSQADYVCSGVDDHLVINTAIDALPEGGGRVHLAAGTYSIGEVKDGHGGIYIRRGNVVLTGVGSGTRLIMQDGLTDINVIWIYGDNISDVTIRDLFIDGNGANHTKKEGWVGCHGIKAVGKTRVPGHHASFSPRNIRVENCHIENCRRMAVMLTGDVVEVCNCYFSGSFGSHTVELLGWNGRIEGCTLRVKNGDSVGYGFSTDACNTFQIINNKVTVEAGGHLRGFPINDWPRAYNGIITGNTVVNNGESGPIMIQGVMALVNNNIIRNVPVIIHGEGVMFGQNMLVHSPLEIKACIHRRSNNNDILNPSPVEEQLPIRIDGNWFCESPVSNVAGNVIIGANVTTEIANAGTATIPDGTNAVVIKHGLSVAPVLVHLSPAAAGADAGIKGTVEDITDEEFTVRVDNEPGAGGVSFYWRAVTEWKNKSGQSYRNGAYE